MSEGALSTIGRLRQGLAMSPSTDSAMPQLKTTGSTSNGGGEEYWPERAEDLLSGGLLPLRFFFRLKSFFVDKALHDLQSFLFQGLRGKQTW